jgi:hypothetical protein
MQTERERRVAQSTRYDASIFGCDGVNNIELAIDAPEATHIVGGGRLVPEPRYAARSMPGSAMG